jgi:hypothetical protein
MRQPINALVLSAPLVVPFQCQGKLPENVVAAGPYDVVDSSRAIHHLTQEQIPLLYADVCANLKPRGSFFNLGTASTEDESVRSLFTEIRLAERGPKATGSERRSSDPLPPSRRDPRAPHRVAQGSGLHVSRSFLEAFGHRDGGWVQVVARTSERD